MYDFFFSMLVMFYDGFGLFVIMIGISIFFL